MQGTSKLQKYFEADGLTSSKLFTDAKFMDELLEDRVMIHLLRYIQDIAHLDAISTARTLMITMRLIMRNLPKIKKMFPFSWVQLSNIQYKGLQPRQVQHLRWIIQKATAYINHMLFTSQSTLEDELELLTTNMFTLLQMAQYPGQKTAQLVDNIYWLIEDRLFHLWLQLQPAFTNIKQASVQQFDIFYQKYVVFCQCRRKVSVVKHSGLKFAVVSPELNRQIEERNKQTKSARKDQPFTEQCIQPLKMQGYQQQVKERDLVVLGQQQEREDRQSQEGEVELCLKPKNAILAAFDNIDSDYQ